MANDGVLRAMSGSQTIASLAWSRNHNVNDSGDSLPVKRLNQ